jgi:SM-20-related protein
VSAMDLAKFRQTPLEHDPFPYLIVPQFIKSEALPALDEDYPVISAPGSYAVNRLRYGGTFARLLEELQGADMRLAFEAKFGIELKHFPVVVTVRGRSGTRDGNIHTDLPGKVITVLLYMNRSWDPEGGRLRLLRSAHDLDDYVAEVPPAEGTLLAFRRSDRSYHGHKRFLGERRVIQLNWVTPRHRRWLRCQEMMQHVADLVKKTWPARKPLVRSHEHAAP